ncbi:MULTISPECIES: hypothetical protein [Glycomyces]|uniref:Uncharacterized protein n=1 Tax=Glycomyces artemisiae TaxID=1076443 RepID=A0A2T0UX39_9ACTN|nr:hypothetical protein [Glycomyces artemisiae]PRY62486.1 hypothetical protein B0I28_101820 [Glycomyces artemisiae]
MADTTEVQRGSFDKDGTRFDVCASSAMAPEAMRVYQAGDRSVIALVVSGLNSGELKASWGSGWGAYPEEWRDDFEERAYRAYVSRVRFCNG